MLLGILILALAVLTLLIVGIIGSFSPLLYITHSSALLSKKAAQGSNLLIAGIVVGVITAGLFFQSLQPNAINIFVKDIADALFAHQIVTLLLCAVICLAGLIVIVRSQNPNKKLIRRNIPVTGLFTLGFARTISSITAITMILFSVQVINKAPLPSLFAPVLYCFVIIGFMLPHVAIRISQLRSPLKMNALYEKLQVLRTARLQSAIGVCLVIASIITGILSFF